MYISYYGFEAALERWHKYLLTGQSDSSLTDWPFRVPNRQATH